MASATSVALGSSTSVRFAPVPSFLGSSSFSSEAASVAQDERVVFSLEVGRSASMSSISRQSKGLNDMVVVLSHHGDDSMSIEGGADVVLPCAAYTEMASTYLSTTAEYLRSRVATRPPGQAREAWRILRALAEMGLSQEVWGRGLFHPASPIFTCSSSASVSERLADFGLSARGFPGSFDVSEGKGSFGPVECTPFYSWIENYYTTDPVSAASSTMAKCSLRSSVASSFSFTPNVGRKFS
jgi:hypothetical protein